MTKESQDEVMEFLNKNQQKLPEKDRNFFFSVNGWYKKGRMTEKQFFWMEKFYKQLLQEEQKVEPEVEKKSWLNSYDLSSLISLMDKASAKLAYPKIKLMGVRDKVEMIIKGGKYYSLTINMPEKKFYFQLSKKGELQRNLPMREELIPMLQTELKFLEDFANNPTEGARLQGKLTSNCCFCCRELTTAESVTAGYGPICADTYGLPWGEIGEDVLGLERDGVDLLEALKS